jgi:hypothetical protein
MTDQSLFAKDRYEYDQQHLYYIPKEKYVQLEECKPVYLIGSRGTGKTTLLMALNWNERINNKQLLSQLANAPFQSRYIGLYMRLPDIQLKSLEEWIQTQNKDLYDILLALYLDLNSLELLSSAIAYLFANGYIDVQPAEERICVQEILIDFPELNMQWTTNDSTCTIKSLEGIFRAMRKHIERHSLLKTSLYEDMKRLPLGQVGSLSRGIAKKLGELCSCNRSQNEEPWHFKVCMDEAECLNERQQLTINTLVRCSHAPLVYIVSFVGMPEEPTRTNNPSLTLQKADRIIILLDEMEDLEFRKFAQGVASVRIQKKLQSKWELDLEKTLGKLSINKLLHAILRDSVSPKAKDLLQKAEELAKEPFFDQRYFRDLQPDEDFDVSSGAPPIYEAYLKEKLEIEFPSPTNEKKWERRRQESQEIRKRMVAAYLSICNDFGLKVRYAFADMLLQMSDKCIRDFLAQMDKLWLEMNVPIEKFLEHRIPLTKQDRALHKASEEKKNSFPRSGVSSPSQIERIVDALARITAIIQRGSSGVQHLKSAERGIFQMKIKDIDEPRNKDVLNLLREAAEAGFLSNLKGEDNKWSFRVHTSLAANYGFSYRGSYYPCSVSVEEISMLHRCCDWDERNKMIEEIARRISNDRVERTPLFDGLT